MNRFPFSELGDQIQDYSDTEKFMLAFDDKKFGQCEETFTEGPDYWQRIPKIREEWREAGLEDEKIVKTIFDSFEELGYSKDRSSAQINELKRATLKGLLIGDI